MAPLYRHLAHPVDGILNSAGESSQQSPVSKSSISSSTKRRNSIISSHLLPAGRSRPANILPWDANFYEELKSDNEKELARIQKEEEEAAEKAGETEVQSARGKRAEFWARVGNKVVTNHPEAVINLGLIHASGRTKRSISMRLFLRRLDRWEPKSTLC